MAMIECTECAAPISDKAKTCIKCGAPVGLPTAGAEDVDLSKRVVTTEQTGKKYKGMQLLGVMMILGGVVSCSMHEPGWSGGLFVLGLVVYAGSRMGAWWDHG